MSESIYARWDLPEVINGVGYSTRVGGSCPSREVVEAMAAAQAAYVEIDDLQSAASACIARHTGAEAGIVTCGAGAALTLAAAACLAGSDPDIMDQLPDARLCRRDTIIYPQPGRFDYDHAVRLSGAVIDTVDYTAPDALAQIEGRITNRTAAIGMVCKHRDDDAIVAPLAQLAHRHGLPLLVDGAQALPPAANLRAFIAAGANLVAISGGKHLGGPQASGLLLGVWPLVRSAWVQMVDMDVRCATWSLRRWIAEGWISRAPRHGIGRSMKISKDGIVGALVALEAYAQRDHAAELALWQARLEQLHEGLKPCAGLELTPLFPAPNGQPFPVLRIRRAAGTGELLRRLHDNRPRVILAEDEDDPCIAYLFTMCLREDQIAPLIDTLIRCATELEKGQ